MAPHLHKAFYLNFIFFFKDEAPHLLVNFFGLPYIYQINVIKTCFKNTKCFLTKFVPVYGLYGMNYYLKSWWSHAEQRFLCQCLRSYGQFALDLQTLRGPFNFLSRNECPIYPVKKKTVAQHGSFMILDD